MSKPLLVEPAPDGLLWLRFNQPERMNAMDRAMGEALTEALTAAAEDEAVRVVLLTGSGKAFSAGGDLRMLEEAATWSPAEIQHHMRTFYAPYLAVRSFPKPVIAVVNGYAIGAGMCVALAADLRIATPEARMGVNFAKLGLAPGMGTTYLLPRTVGVAHALDLLFTGRLVAGEEALRMGLVNRLAPAEELEAAATAWAQEIARAAPLAVRYIKANVYAALELDLDQALDREAYSQALTFVTEDLREGLAAVRERRDPTFHGR